MMAIIISDIHGDIEKARAFLAYRPEAEHIVLGDLVDNVRKGITLDDELACLDLLFSSNTKTLWGNHDLAYPCSMFGSRATDPVLSELGAITMDPSACCITSCWSSCRPTDCAGCNRK